MIKLIAICATLLLTSTAGHSKEFLTQMSSEMLNLKAEVVKQEKLRRQLALDIAPIKNMSEMQVVINEKSPLDLLSEPAKERFLNSLTFGNNGLTGFDISDLEAELTPTQIHAVLSLFGAQYLVNRLENARVESTTDALLLSTKIIAIDSIPSADDFNHASSYGSGAGGISGGDHKGYYCSGRATCSERQGSICMSSC